MKLQKLFPTFFPDATRAVLKTLDSKDLESTNTPGILVNTYHLYWDPGPKVISSHGGVKKFMNWKGAVISDSGGFQVMSLIKKHSLGAITDRGISTDKGVFTPEDSIKFQFDLGSDMVVVLDDFTPPNATRKEAAETVSRTIKWAARSKIQFEKEVKKRKLVYKPLLLAVVQGGEFLDLREYCAKELAKIGFDGFGYGGWPVKADGSFNYDVAKVIAKNAPKNYILYGLGVGKPEDIVGMVDLGYGLFDCVLPTRDARHKRLYIYNTNSINSINLRKKSFYKFYQAGKLKDLNNTNPISKACDCLLCTNYSKGYLAHLFRIGDSSAYRLATIHNLRFYSILMEKLKEETIHQSMSADSAQ